MNCLKLCVGVKAITAWYARPVVWFTDPIKSNRANNTVANIATIPFPSLRARCLPIINYQRIQENLVKGGLYGRNAKGKRSHTRAVKGIDGDVKLNRALWVMAENMLQLAA